MDSWENLILLTFLYTNIPVQNQRRLHNLQKIGFEKIEYIQQGSLSDEISSFIFSGIARCGVTRITCVGSVPQAIKWPNLSLREGVCSASLLDS